MAAGLAVGAVGDLQAKAVIKARQHQAKRGVVATGEHARALVGHESQAAHGLPYRVERAGLELVGVVERVGDGSQRDACLVGDILDSDFSHGGPCAEARGGLDVSSRAV